MAPWTMILEGIVWQCRNVDLLYGNVKIIANCEKYISH
jgi:hypothetical protein